MLSQRTGLGLNVKSPPRALSKEDALSVRVHSSSPLVPSSVLVSPVLRMHLVDSELGSPINPSGEPTTPLQTAPFDLSRRLKSAYAAEWEETLDVEEELGGLLSNRAVLLFELLQPPSFQFYDERPDVFPGGRPARVAWGFPQAPAHQGPEAQPRAIAGAAVQVGGEGVERARGAHSRPVVGRDEFPDDAAAASDRRRLRRVQIRDQDFRRAARAVPRAHQRDGILVASRRRGHRAPLGVPRDAEAAVARRFRRRFIGRRQGRRRYLRESASQPARADRARAHARRRLAHRGDEAGARPSRGPRGGCG